VAEKWASADFRNPLVIHGINSQVTGGLIAVADAMQDILEERNLKHVAFLREQKEELDTAIAALLEYQRLVERRLERQESELQLRRQDQR